MKFDFKKITSVLASAVMLGSTIGIAAAANYPSPFIVGGSADVRMEGDFLALENVHGKTIVDDKYLRIEGFSGEYVPGSSFAASKLMNLTRSDS